MKTREIRPLRSLDSEITVPGSKSYTARALIVGALAHGATILRNPLRAEDTDYMIQGLRALSVQIHEESESLIVEGTGGNLSALSETIYLGGAGTAVRFMTSVAALSGNRVIIDGNKRMRQRPIQDLLDALRPLGIRAQSLNRNGCPPVIIENGRFEGGRTTLRGGLSSQFLSSLLLCGPCARKGVEVEVTGELVSQSYVDLTIAMMTDFGAQITHRDHRTFRVLPCPYRGSAYSVEGDMSSASYFFAAAAITGGRIRVKGINEGTRQGDRGLLDILSAMGCRVRWATNCVEVTGGPLSGVDVSMKTMPDMAQTLAVVAAFAKGATRISEIGHLRFKESDRLAGLERELRRIGIHAVAEDKSLVVHGGDPQGAEIETYGDHRMAMAFAVAGLRVPQIVIGDPDCVSKSFPTFWTLFEGLR